MYLLTMKPLILLLFVLLAIPKIALNQTVVEEDTQAPQQHPYQVSFKQEIPYLIAGFTLTSAGIIASQLDDKQRHQEADLPLLNANNIHSFDRGALDNWSPTADRHSGYLRWGTTLLPAVFVFHRSTRKDLVPLIVMASEVFSINYGSTILTKHLVKRSRPFTYNETLSVEDRTRDAGRLSFYSGHTSHTASFTFFIAKVIHDYHPNASNGLKIAVWSSAIAIPATSAYLRVQAGEHFPTDVLAGYAIGALIGYAVPALHKRQANRPDRKMSLVPSMGQETLGFRMTYRL